MTQSIAMAILGEDPAWTTALREAYTKKRDLTVAAVRAIPGLDCDTPEGTFYVWADVSAFGLTAGDFCDALLDEAGVAVTPGDAFGNLGVGFIRFNLAGPLEPIVEGLRRLDGFVRRRFDR